MIIPSLYFLFSLLNIEIATATKESVQENDTKIPDNTQEVKSNIQEINTNTQEDNKNIIEISRLSE